MNRFKGYLALYIQDNIAMKIGDLFELIHKYETDEDEKKQKYDYVRKALENGWNDKDDVSTLLENSCELVRKVAASLSVDETEVYEGFADIFGYRELVDEYPELTKPFAYEVEFSDDGAHEVHDKLDEIYSIVSRVEGWMNVSMAVGCITMFTSIIALFLTHPNPF